MAARRKRSAIPAPMVELTGRGLSPLSAADEELLARFKPGQVFDLVPQRRERSLDQLKLYWSVLHHVCEATGAWSRAEILHDFLMRHCGYASEQINPFTEQWEEVRDSVALDALSQEAMNDYCTAALAALGAWLGIDPLDLLPKRREPRHDAAA